MALVVVLGAWAGLHGQIATIRNEAYDRLDAVATVKAEQIARWRRTHAADALRLARSPAVRDAVLRLGRDLADAGVRAQLGAGLDLEREVGSYGSAWLLDGERRVLAASPRGLAAPGGDAIRRLLDEAAAGAGAGISDLHTAPGARPGSMQVASGAALRDAAGSLVGFVVLRCEVDHELGRLVAAWPGDDASVESMLLQRDRDEVVFAIGARHGDGAPLSLRLPLHAPQADIVGIKAVTGAVGPLQGLDYRGTPVVAAARPVPQSPWVLVAKIDRSALQAVAARRTALVAAVVAALLLATGAATAYLLRRRQAMTLAALHEQAAAREAMQRSILDSLSAHLVVLDRDGRIVATNEAWRAFARANGGPPELELGIGLDYLAACGSSAARVAAGIRAVLQGRAPSYADEYDCDGPTAARRFALNVTPCRAAAGGVVVAHENVTERALAERARRAVESDLRRSLAEKNALLKEVHHRVKNNLQVISSLVRMEERRADATPVRAALRGLQQRIRAMALLHESLMRTGDLAEVCLARYLRAIVDELLRAQADPPGRIRLDFDADEDAVVAPEHAVPCGLVVNELVSNALAHAWPDSQPGLLRVSMRHDDEHGLTIVVADDGPGLAPDVAVRRRARLGLQLVDDLCRQIGAQVDIASSGHGVVCTVRGVGRCDSRVWPRERLIEEIVA